MVVVVPVHCSQKTNLYKWMIKYYVVKISLLFVVIFHPLLPQIINSFPLSAFGCIPVIQLQFPLSSKRLYLIALHAYMVTSHVRLA